MDEDERITPVPFDREEGVKKRISHMFETWEGADVIFLLGEEEEPVLAHKTILQLSTPQVAKLVDDLPNCARVWLRNEDPVLFKRLLKLIYTDEIEPENISAFLSCASSFGFTKLPNTLLTIAKRQPLSVETVIYTFNLANFRKDEELENNCVEFIKRNAEAVFKHFSVKEMDKELMEMLLNSDDISCPDEIVLFSGLLQWAKHRSCDSESDLSEIVGELRFAIRFTLIPYETLLAKVKSSGVLNPEEFGQLLRTIMDPDENPLCLNLNKRKEAVSKKISRKRKLPSPPLPPVIGSIRSSSEVGLPKKSYKPPPPMPPIIGSICSDTEALLQPKTYKQIQTACENIATNVCKEETSALELLPPNFDPLKSYLPIANKAAATQTITQPLLNIPSGNQEPLPEVSHSIVEPVCVPVDNTETPSLEMGGSTKAFTTTVIVPAQLSLIPLPQTDRISDEPPATGNHPDDGDDRNSGGSFRLRQITGERKGNSKSLDFQALKSNIEIESTTEIHPRCEILENECEKECSINCGDENQPESSEKAASFDLCEIQFGGSTNGSPECQSDGNSSTQSNTQDAIKTLSESVIEEDKGNHSQSLIKAVSETENLKNDMNGNVTCCPLRCEKISGGECKSGTGILTMTSEDRNGLEVQCSSSEISSEDGGVLAEEFLSGEIEDEILSESLTSSEDEQPAISLQEEVSPSSENQSWTLEDEIPSDDDLSMPLSYELPWDGENESENELTLEDEVLSEDDNPQESFLLDDKSSSDVDSEPNYVPKSTKAKETPDTEHIIKIETIKSEVIRSNESDSPFSSPPNNNFLQEENNLMQLDYCASSPRYSISELHYQNLLQEEETASIYSSSNSEESETGGNESPFSSRPTYNSLLEESDLMQMDSPRLTFSELQERSQSPPSQLEEAPFIHPPNNFEESKSGMLTQKDPQPTIRNIIHFMKRTIEWKALVSKIRGSASTVTHIILKDIQFDTWTFPSNFRSYVRLPHLKCFTVINEEETSVKYPNKRFLPNASLEDLLFFWNSRKEALHDLQVTIRVESGGGTHLHVYPEKLILGYPEQLEANRILERLPKTLRILGLVGCQVRRPKLIPTENINELYLFNVGFEEMPMSTYLSLLPNLRVLSLKEKSIPKKICFIDFQNTFSGCRNTLEELFLSNATIDNLHKENFPNLRRLYLNECKTMSNFYRNFPSLLPSLEEFSFSGREEGIRYLDLKHVTNCLQIRSISVDQELPIVHRLTGKRRIEIEGLYKLICRIKNGGKGTSFLLLRSEGGIWSGAEFTFEDSYRKRGVEPLFSKKVLQHLEIDEDTFPLRKEDVEVTDETKNFDDSKDFSETESSGPKKSRIVKMMKNGVIESIHIERNELL